MYCAFFLVAHTLKLCLDAWCAEVTGQWSPGGSKDYDHWLAPRHDYIMSTRHALDNTVDMCLTQMYMDQYREMGERKLLVMQPPLKQTGRPLKWHASRIGGARHPNFGRTIFVHKCVEIFVHKCVKTVRYKRSV